MAGISWRQSLSKSRQAELYALYVLLCNSSFPLPNKQAIFESAADGPHSWPIIKVTEKALKYIAENGHANLLRRAHATKRADRAKYMFRESPMMGQLELFEYFFGLDPVTLALAKSEAGRHGHAHFSRQIDVPPSLFTRSGKGTAVYVEEFDWAVATLNLHKAAFEAFSGKIRRKRPPKADAEASLNHLAENTDEDTE